MLLLLIVKLHFRFRPIFDPTCLGHRRYRGFVTLVSLLDPPIPPLSFSGLSCPLRNRLLKCYISLQVLSCHSVLFTVLEKYQQILLQENMKAAPDKSHFFLTRFKFLGHIIERNTITSIKSCIDAIQKLQPPSNKKKKYKNFLEC